MPNKIPERGNFSVSSEVLDEHEWVTDWFIDGELGSDCTIYYPPTDSECPNCLFDPTSGQSANIYKTGGPIEFQNHTLCPWCGGTGRKEAVESDSIRLRVYWSATGDFTNAKEFNASLRAAGFDKGEGDAFVIGYFSDLPKFRRSNYILLYNSFSPEEWKCHRSSEVKPWGFRKNRYFCCMIKRNV